MTLTSSLILTFLWIAQDPGGAKHCDEQSQGTASVVETVRLKRVAPKSWEVILPGPAWHPLTNPLIVNEHRFAVSTDARGDLRLDTTGDGRKDTAVRAGHSIIQLSAPGIQPYALRLRRAGITWEWSNAEVMQGEIEGQLLTLIDLNGDGRFDEYGTDAMTIAEKAAASHLSRVVSMAGRLYHLDIAPDGTQASTRPYTAPCARLNVVRQFQSRGELVSAIFQSGDYSFDFSEAHSGLRVPAGEYTFRSGLVSFGNESARMAGTQMAPIVLADGEDRDLSWGGPLNAQFRCRIRNGELTVFSNLRFTGSGGESYFDFFPEASAPRIRVLDASSGKIVQYGQMGGCCGGGFSAFVARVPRSTPLDVQLIHERRIFEKISGRVRAIPCKSKVKASGKSTDQPPR